MSKASEEKAENVFFILFSTSTMKNKFPGLDRTYFSKRNKSDFVKYKKKSRSTSYPEFEIFMLFRKYVSTPQNTPPDVDLPTRKTRSSLSTRTQALVPSTRKPTQSTEPTLATGDRHQKQRKLRTCSLRKGDPKHSKLSKMRRQRNTQQMKEQGKNPPDLTNKEEIASLPEKEFRVMIVKMIQNLGNRMEKIQETFNKDLEEIKSKQTVMNNTINEI